MKLDFRQATKSSCNYISITFKLHGRRFCKTVPVPWRPFQCPIGPLIISSHKFRRSEIDVTSFQSLWNFVRPVDSPTLWPLVTLDDVNIVKHSIKKYLKRSYDEAMFGILKPPLDHVGITPPKPAFFVQGVLKWDESVFQVSLSKTGKTLSKTRWKIWRTLL